MSIHMVEKQKSVPESYHKHRALVPLRFVEAGSSLGESKARDLASFVSPGDICVIFPGCYSGSDVILNCTTGKSIPGEFRDYLKFLRAYNIASIYIANDNEPAPVI